MNLLKTIIERLNQRVEVANIFDKQFGLCELNANGNDKAWVHYIGNGQAEVVTNFDAKQGTLFWAKRGKVTVVKTDAYKMSGCKQLYVTSFPLTAYAVVRKSHLPCDGDDAQDWLASRIYKLTSGTDPLFKQNLGVINYEVIPSGYINEIKTLTANYEFACVTVDFDVQVITTTEDGCYDICATGDIPLPDLQPCTPCLTEVAVDGVTIIGNGTAEDPLIAIGGGGGGGIMTAIAFSTDHLSATGNQYVIGNVVWYLGNIYRCIANNDSLLPTNTTYWTNLGAGFQTIERPADWTSSSGNNQILNKPTIPVLPATIVESVGGTAPIASSGGANPDISISQADGSTDGYLSSADWSTFNGKFDVPTGTNTDYLDGLGTPTPFPTIPTGTVTSVDLTMPVAFTVTGNPVLTSGTLAVAAAGLATQYIRGDGQLATLPSNASGGSAVSYYLNGGTAASVATYFQMSQIAVVGIGTNADFNKAGNGLISQWLTDVGDPNRLEIPAGNWNFEIFMSASSIGGTPAFYVELLKYDGITFTTIANSSLVPEAITGGTIIDLYLTSLAIPQTTLLVTDRLALRVYIVNSVGGRTITMHTQDSHLCQVITNFAGGISALNGLTANTQYLAVGMGGTDFGISSATDTHTFNLPTASAANRGALSAANWSTFNGKQDALVSGTNIKTINSTSILGSGNIVIPTIYKSTTDTATITGITNQLVASQLIPANTFAVGDIIKILARYRKSTTLVNMTTRIYVNSANNLTGALLLGTYSLVGLYSQLERNLFIKSATNTETFGNTSSFYIDSGTTNAVSSTSVDWTINQYIIFAGQQGVAGETTLVSGFLIEKL
jgi:hypothetical protein